VRITTVAHATEDVGKIVVAINHLSTEDIVSSNIKRMRLKGHYGNVITTFTLSLKGVSAKSFFHQLWSGMSKDDRFSIIQSLENRLDPEGRFYLRLDKQAAFQGNFRLSEQDPIKLEVSFINGHDSFQDQPSKLRRMLESEDGSRQVET